MNQTQTEIIAFTFGLFFSYTGIDIFLENIAPLILKTSTPEMAPILVVLIGLVSILSSFLTILALKDIVSKIEYTYRRHRNIFDKYMMKNVVTFVISFLVFAFLKLKIGI